MQRFLIQRRAWHNRAMPEEPIMTPKAGGFFSEWSVEIVWPSGHKDKVTGFKNEAHARGWIAHESKAWIAEMRAPRRS
jgi:hypothetical protein